MSYPPNNAPGMYPPQGGYYTGSSQPPAGQPGLGYPAPGYQQVSTVKHLTFYHTLRDVL